MKWKEKSAKRVNSQVVVIKSIQDDITIKQYWECYESKEETKKKATKFV
jgi:hypothetical protein